MRWFVLFLAFALLIPAQILSSAPAAWASDSNYYVFFYPRADCREPNFPRDNDQKDWNYFYRDLERYVGCMQRYLQNTGKDIERIKERAQYALRDYEEFMDKVKRRQERR
jgi:hypothetical protein